jgi:hypothetical protein
VSAYTRASEAARKGAAPAMVHGAAEFEREYARRMAAAGFSGSLFIPSRAESDRRLNGRRPGSDSTLRANPHWNSWMLSSRQNTGEEEDD